MGRRFGSHIRNWVPIATVFSLVTSIGLIPASAVAGADSADDTLQRTSPHEQEGSQQFRITTLSSRDDLISGDSVLVRIEVSSGVPLNQVTVDLSGVDVTLPSRRTRREAMHC
jgi:Tannase-like family of unknown function (DUF6351)